MPRALTIEEKKAKILNAKAADKGEIPSVVRVATDRSTRRTRGVFNGTMGKLQVPAEARARLEEAGWHLHIFNDTPGRIEEALQAGYEFVTPEEIGSAVTSVVSKNTALDDKVRYLVGTSEKGDGMYAYLMKTQTEYYEEDHGQLQKRNDYIDQQIKSGKNVAAGSSSEGFYNAGIKFNN